MANSEYKAVRDAYEDYGKFIRENPAPEKDAPAAITEEYARKVLNRLDRLERFAIILSDAKMTGSFSEDAEMPDDDKDYEAYAKEQKLSLLKDMKERKIAAEADDVNEFRKNLAIHKMTESLAELKEMQSMPKEEEGKKKLLNCASDIMVGRVAMSDSVSGQKMLAEYGILGIKEKVGYNRGFQTFLATCIKNEKMTGEKLGEELMGNKVSFKVEAVKQENNASKNAPTKPVIGK